jgi:hypothetical protein
VRLLSEKLAKAGWQRSICLPWPDLEIDQDWVHDKTQSFDRMRAQTREKRPSWNKAFSGSYHGVMDSSRASAVVNRP